VDLATTTIAWGRGNCGGEAGACSREGTVYVVRWPARTLAKGRARGIARKWQRIGGREACWMRGQQQSLAR